MAKPLNKNMDIVIAKYKTGEYRLTDLANEYDIDKGYLARYFKKHNIQRAKEGMIIEEKMRQVREEEKEKIKTYHNSAKQLEQMENEADLKAFNSKGKLEKKYYRVLAETFKDDGVEILDLARKRNLQFAKGFHTLSALIIQKAGDILQRENLNSSDLRNLSVTIQTLNEVLGVFPKIPTFAQQINIGQAQDKIIGSSIVDEMQKFDINIEFVEANNKDE